MPCLCGIAGAIVLAAAASESQGTGYEFYYEAVDATNVVGPVAVRVDDLVKRGPAEKAGVLAGDSVVALDGYRIYSRAEFSGYVKCVRNSTRVEFTVRRKSELKTVVVEDIPSKGITGCYISDGGPSIWSALREQWNIAPDDFLDIPDRKRKEDKPDALADVVDAFNISPPPPSLMTARVAAFPRRGVNALLVLGARHSEADQLWVIGLMKAYCALADQRYADLKDLAVRHGLSRSTHDPFLDGLAGFYLRVAEQPPSQASGIPLSAYGVGPLYFAHCFPFPIIPERRTDWFAFDRDFQNDFDQATSVQLHRNGASCPVAERHFSSELTQMEDYADGVRCALIDPKNHGGWPFRHPSLYDGKTLSVLVDALWENLDKEPERKVLTSFALLAPSLLANELTYFKKSYQTVCDAGTREMAIANWIIDNTMRSWRRDRPEFLTAQHEIACTTPAPDVYNLLAARSPAINRYVQNGCFDRDDYVILDVGGYCMSNPDAVVAALPKTAAMARGGEDVWWSNPAVKYKRPVGKRGTVFGPHHWNKDERGAFLFCPIGLAASDEAELLSIPALIKASSAEEVSPIVSGNAASLCGGGWKGGALSDKLGRVLAGNGAGTAVHASMPFGDSCAWTKDATVFSITHEGATLAGIDGMAFSRDGSNLYSNINEPAEMRSVICKWNVISLSSNGMGLTSNSTFRTSISRVRNLSVYQIGGRDLVYYGEGDGGGKVCVYDPGENQETTLIAEGLRAGLSQYDIVNVKVGGVSAGKMHLYVQCDGGTLYVYELAANGKSVGACVRFFSAAGMQMRLGAEWVNMRAFEVTDDETYAFFSHHPSRQQELVQLYVVWALSGKQAR